MRSLVFFCRFFDRGSTFPAFPYTQTSCKSKQRDKSATLKPRTLHISMNVVYMASFTLRPLCSHAKCPSTHCRTKVRWLDTKVGLENFGYDAKCKICVRRCCLSVHRLQDMLRYIFYYVLHVGKNLLGFTNWFMHEVFWKRFSWNLQLQLVSIKWN
jgi:ubiquitin C-terminal hydrolase